MQTHYLEENGNVKEVDQYQNKMKKSQLRNIIRKSIKQLIGEHIHPTLGNYDHHIDPNNPSATIASLYGGPPPLYGDGTHVYHYKGNICPAKFAMHYTGLPISDVQNFHWLNQQYAAANIPPALGDFSSKALISGLSCAAATVCICASWS